MDWRISDFRLTGAVEQKNPPAPPVTNTLRMDQFQRAFIVSPRARASIVTPMSRAIWRMRIGEISRPARNGSVVQRPSACRYWRCESCYLTTTKPRAGSRASTSRGLKTRTRPTIGRRRPSGYRRTRLRGAAHRLPEAKHGNHFLKVGVDFIQVGALRMGAGKPRDKADV